MGCFAELQRPSLACVSCAARLPAVTSFYSPAQYIKGEVHHGCAPRLLQTPSSLARWPTVADRSTTVVFALQKMSLLRCFFRLSLLSNKKSQFGRAEWGQREESGNWKLACCCCCCCLSAVLTPNHSRHRGGRTQKTPAATYVASTTLTARNGGDELHISPPRWVLFIEKSRAPGTSRQVRTDAFIQLYLLRRNATPEQRRSAHVFSLIACE